MSKVVWHSLIRCVRTCTLPSAFEIAIAPPRSFPMLVRLPANPSFPHSWARDPLVPTDPYALASMVVLITVVGMVITDVKTKRKKTSPSPCKR